jgi:hypothetical protein
VGDGLVHLRPSALGHDAVLEDGVTTATVPVPFAHAYLSVAPPYPDWDLARDWIAIGTSDVPAVEGWHELALHRAHFPSGVLDPVPLPDGLWWLETSTGYGPSVDPQGNLYVPLRDSASAAVHVRAVEEGAWTRAGRPVTEVSLLEYYGRGGNLLLTSAGGGSFTPMAPWVPTGDPEVLIGNALQLLRLDGLAEAMADDDDLVSSHARFSRDGCHVAMWGGAGAGKSLTFLLGYERVPLEVALPFTAADLRSEWMR